MWNYFLCIIDLLSSLTETVAIVLDKNNMAPNLITVLMLMWTVQTTAKQQKNPRKEKDERDKRFMRKNEECWRVFALLRQCQIAFYLSSQTLFSEVTFLKIKAKKKWYSSFALCPENNKDLSNNEARNVLCYCLSKQTLLSRHPTRHVGAEWVDGLDCVDLIKYFTTGVLSNEKMQCTWF